MPEAIANPCDSCAFRVGCATHDAEPYNRLRSMICATAGIPFFCHHGFDWQGAEIFQINGRFISISGEPMEDMKVCAGWKKEVARLKKRGQFAVSPDARALQIKMGHAALSLIRRFVDAPEDSPQKQQYLRDLRVVTEMLFQKPEAA